MQSLLTESEAMKDKLTIKEFGDPVLRKNSQKISRSEIYSTKILKLIDNMRKTLLEKDLGIGLAAPQIGQSISLAVIAIRPSKRRPKAEQFDLVIINPIIVKTYGNRIQQYEGCISGGSGSAGLFAKVPRYKKLELNYYDENGKRQIKIFEGLKAHVIQHEVDHLNGVLFVDRVKDRSTYMTKKEYLKMIKKQSSRN